MLNENRTQDHFQKEEWFRFRDEQNMKEKQRGSSTKGLSVGPIKLGLGLGGWPRGGKGSRKGASQMPLGTLSECQA